MSKILLVLLLFTFSSLDAQEYSSLKGQVIDSETLLPIPFAHIRFDESIAVSNQRGDFILKFQETELNRNVIVSCIGYKSASFPIASIRKSKRAVLTPDITALGELVFSGLGPQAIFRKAEERGQKNYKTSKYKADYTIDQWVFFENSDSLMAVSKESGTLLNKGLDATGAFPKFRELSKEVSPLFLKYDTHPTPLSFLSKKGNTVAPNHLYSYDPVNVGMIKQFSAVPAIFSEGFYQNTLQQTQSIVTLDSSDYYLITVYPKPFKKADAAVGSDEEELKKKFRELAAQLGRTLSEHTLDSVLSAREKGGKLLPYVMAMGIFLVNTQNYGISHALIKMNTFDSYGNILSKSHVAASYIEIEESYYLQSLDVLMKRSSPSTDKDKMLYYLLSLKLSNFETKKMSKLVEGKNQTKITQLISAELQAQFRLETVQQFIKPFRDCTECEINPMKYFNRTF